MTDSKTISSPSVWFFIGITAVYSTLQYFATSPSFKTMLTLVYFLVVIVVQFFLNLNVAKQLCGSPQYGTAALVTFVPWFAIFGLLKMLLVVFPGWLAPFSNTLGYLVASLAGVKDTLNDILKPKIHAEGKSAGAADALEHIYNDPSLLINEITPRNFDVFWKRMQSLFKPGAEAHESKLRKLVQLKDIVSEFVWFVLAGSLVASISFNYMINRTCTQSIEAVRKSAEAATITRTKATQEASKPQRVYSTYE